MVNDEHLLKLAQRAATSETLIAAWIARQIEAERQTWDEAARSLNIDRLQLARLALCRRPRADHFEEDVDQIAAYVNMNKTGLTQFARRMETLDRMRRNVNPPWLMAARDNDDPLDPDS